MAYISVISVITEITVSKENPNHKQELLELESV